MNDILSYLEMCQREGVNLQRGMNFQIGRGYSVILMSTRRGAPYRDWIDDEGKTLIYEGHDMPQQSGGPDVKTLAQPEVTQNGALTENGKFHKAAQEFKRGARPAEIVRVYEKIRAGIWAYNGVFHLIDSWQEHDGARTVFRFKLLAVETQDDLEDQGQHMLQDEPDRLIPTPVKLAVWTRDRGRCVLCGATQNLHFDHVIPFSKGGTSLVAENIQLLCVQCNLRKSARIE